MTRTNRSLRLPLIAILAITGMFIAGVHFGKASADEPVEMANDRTKQKPKPAKQVEKGGKPVNGLRLTLAADKNETTMLPDGSDAAPIKLKLTFTNVSTERIKLNAYLPSCHLKFDATGPDPESIHTSTGELDIAFKPAVAKDYPVIQPGQSWSPDWIHWFPGAFYQHLARLVVYQTRKPGTYTLRFTYDSDVANGTWAGSVVSNEFVLTVRPSAKAEKARRSCCA